MTTCTRKLLQLFAVSALALTSLAQTAAQDIDLWLAGDSTVRNGVNGGVGWGDVVHTQFDLTTFDVVNRAVGGRSARSYYRDEFSYAIENFPPSFGSVWGPGDYLIMQFGHNDGDPATNHLGSIDGIGEETVAGFDKNGNPETVHTFGWYLRQMVQKARDVGAVPIIASRVPRAGDTNETPSAYALWAQQVAQAEGVAFINLYSSVTAHYNDLRAAHPGDPNYIRNTYFGPDSTHTNQAGAELNAEFVAQGIMNLTGDAAGLKNFLLVPEPEPEPVIEIRETVIDGDQISIVFDDAFGMEHSLLATADLASGGWAPAPGSSHEQTGETAFRFVAPIDGFDRRFFRVAGNPPVLSIVDGETYQFVNVGSGRVLEVSAREVRQGTDKETADQQWTVTGIGAGLYNLLVESDGEALDHYYGVTDGNNIGTWTYGGTTKVNQQFTIEPVEQGVFKIASAYEPLDYAIGPAGFSDADEASVVQAPYVGDPHQHWRIYTPGQPIPPEHTVYLLGDSTVSDWSSGYYPKTGWGQVLQRFFDPRVAIRNRAISGTSSKNFYTFFWPAVRDMLEPGDFVLIGFGINDAAADEERRTEPFGSFQDYLTLYVNETLAAGAYPVIVSTVRRNAWNGTNPDTLYPAYHDYPVASRQLAGELGLPLIDLDQLTVPLLEPLGPGYTGPFMYMVLDSGEYPNYPGGQADNVHFQEMGAIEMARLVVDGIQLLSADPQVGALLPYLKPVHSVTVTRNLQNAGITTRTASYPEGTPVTLKAKPNAGYSFQRWESPVGSTVSTDPILQFQAGTSNVTYQAVFVQD